MAAAVAPDQIVKIACAGHPCGKCGKVPAKFKWCNIPGCINRAITA